MVLGKGLVTREDHQWKQQPRLIRPMFYKSRITELQARDDDGQSMPEQQIIDESLTIFSAGQETTANALCWTL